MFLIKNIMLTNLLLSNIIFKNLKFVKIFKKNMNKNFLLKYNNIERKIFKLFFCNFIILLIIIVIINIVSNVNKSFFTHNIGLFFVNKNVKILTKLVSYSKIINIMFF